MFRLQAVGLGYKAVCCLKKNAKGGFMKRNMAKQAARLLLRGTVFAIAAALVFAGCLPGPGTAVFTVTFEPLNGTPSWEVDVEEGQLVDEPDTPTWAAHVFDGWYTDNGTFKFRFDFDNTPITKDITLFAKWEDAEGKYIVTFHRNGGTGTPPPQQAVDPGFDIQLPSGSRITKPGFSFGGWNTRADGTGTNWRAGATYRPTKSITLYAEWVDYGSGPEFPLIEMVQIRSGSFTMGDDSGIGESDERPAHRVTVSAFKMGRYEVTQEQFEDVMGYNPSWFDGSPAYGEEQGKRPVEYVSWLDAVSFCNALSEKERRTKVYTVDGDMVTMDRSADGYRLPTEAEWEYACRAGTDTQWSFGDDDTDIDKYAWTGGNSDSRTHEVGKKYPNPWGLYDMHGNVVEWCWDWYGSGYYGNSLDTDPEGPEGQASRSYRVVRGGDWYYWSAVARSACRGSTYGDSYDLGFRVVCK